MKILQISDLHLLAPGGLLHGIDPLARLDAALAHLSARHADADLLVATGDLAQNGEPAAYEALRERLGRLAIPARLLLGNHDSREAFLAAFPGQPLEEGFAQAVLDLAQGRILLLDTLSPGRAEGELCAARLDWIGRRLREAKGRRVLVFLHHPPADCGIPLLDHYRLEQRAELLALLREHGGVEGVFGGHIHRPFTVFAGGVPVSVVKSLHHQSRLAFADPYAVELSAAPGYGVIHWGPAFTRIHFEDVPPPPVSPPR